MYKTLKAKGQTWVLNQAAPFLIDEVPGIITEIYDEGNFIGIEISINNSGEILTMRVPIVNKEIDDFETNPPQVSIKEEIQKNEGEIKKVLGKTQKTIH